MSVPCPRCGRDYDVALFQFGRTIHCTCGSRVGLEPRILGCDALFEAEILDGVQVI